MGLELEKDLKMQIPHTTNLPVHHLVSVFSKTTNSYKYFWFLAILENIKNDNNLISVDELVIEMICEVWYPVICFKLNLGKQDKLSDAISKIQSSFQCQKDIGKEDLRELLKSNQNNNFIKELIDNLSRYVPMRFLTPWFSDNLQGIKDSKKDGLIKELSQIHFNDGKYSIYRLSKDGSKVEINASWFYFLQKHLHLLLGYTYWHLINYLQKNNPNVPNITSKLHPSESRDLSVAKRFWDSYFSLSKNVFCIYSGKQLSIDYYSIDHFLPWSFVGHDKLWNLIPTLKEVNSSKGDKLPADSYIEVFANLQYYAFHSLAAEYGANKSFMEDYSLLFNMSGSEIEMMPKNVFKNKIKSSIQPQMQIAENMGFQQNWLWK